MKLLKFQKSSIELNKVLCEQKSFYDKGGLGFTKNIENATSSQNKPIVFLKEGHKPKSIDVLVNTSTRDQHVSRLSQTKASLNVFSKPLFPQSHFAIHKDNTLHNLIEFTNDDEHDNNLNPKCDVLSDLDNDVHSSMFTND